MLINIFKISRKQANNINRRNNKTKQKPTQKSKFRFVVVASIGRTNILMGVDFKLLVWSYHRARSLLITRSCQSWGSQLLLINHQIQDSLVLETVFYLSEYSTSPFVRPQERIALTFLFCVKMFSESVSIPNVISNHFFPFTEVRLCVFVSDIYLAWEFWTKKKRAKSSLCLIYFSVAVMKYSEKSDLRKEDLIFAYDQGTVFHVRESRLQELKAADCTTPTVVEQRETKAG